MVIKKYYRLAKELHQHKNDKFERTYVKETYNRLIPFLLIFYVIEWGLYAIEHKLFFMGRIILSYQLINTVVIIVLLLMNRHFEKLSTRVLKTPVFLWSVATMLFGVALVFHLQYKTDLIHMFMMMTVGIAAAIHMHPIEGFFSFSIPALIFFFGLPSYQSDASIVIIGQINVVIFTAISLYLTANLYFLRYSDYCAKAKLIAKNNILDNLSRMDLMTNLYNHKSILDILRENTDYSKRYGSDLSILLIDIDNFKEVNDEYGHLVGDDVIKVLAETLGNNSRATDKVGRYGGEEFLVVMPNTSIQRAISYYNRIRTALQDKVFSNGLHITISAGVAFYDKQDITSLLRDADTNLYKAKRQGKNRCISAKEE